MLRSLSTAPPPATIVSVRECSPDEDVVAAHPVLPASHPAAVEKPAGGGGAAPGQATVWASSLNLINNVVGAGLFSMPWTMKMSSMAGGIVLCLVTCFVNSVCYLLLARSCDLSLSYTYLDIGRKAFGVGFGKVAQGCVLFYSLGSCLSFVVLTADFLGGHTGAFPLSRTAAVWWATLAVFLPLSLLRTTEKLKWTSFASFLACFGAAGLITATAVWRPHDAFAGDRAEALRRGDVNVVYAAFSTDSWAAVPVVNVAFTAHYNAPRFYQELRTREVSTFSLVVAYSMVFSLVVYAGVGVAGYLTFGEDTLGSILLNYSPSWHAAVWVRCMLALIVAFTFPLANHAARESVFSLLSDGRVTTNTASDKTFVATTLLLVLGTVLLGINLEKIETVLAFKGALFGTCVVYIFPPVMYTQLLLNREHAEKEGRLLAGLALDPTDSGGLLEGEETDPMPSPSIAVAPSSPVGGPREVLIPKQRIGPFGFARKMGWLLLIPIWGAVTGTLSIISLVGSR